MKSQFALFATQNLWHMFNWGSGGHGYAILIPNVFLAGLLCVLFPLVLTELYVNGLGADTTDGATEGGEATTLYSVFDRADAGTGGGYESWSVSSDPSGPFATYMTVCIFAFTSYLPGLYYLAANLYFHVFQERFNGMLDIVQIYGGKKENYWGSKFFTHGLFFLPFPIIGFVTVSFLPHIYSNHRAYAEPMIFTLFAQVVFPVLSVLLFSAVLGLTYGNSAGKAEGAKSLLTNTAFLSGVAFLMTDLLLSSPNSFSAYIAEFTFNRGAADTRTCEAIVSPVGAYFGAILHFFFGILLPGYTGAKMWIQMH
ncbi:unnamed protein product, partial [Amoebophrya sp. A120]|eukprot:GSA120T00011106001.1